jgi:hypothetical protein
MAGSESGGSDVSVVSRFSPPPFKRIVTSYPLYSVWAAMFTDGSMRLGEMNSTVPASRTYRVSRLVISPPSSRTIRPTSPGR